MIIGSSASERRRFTRVMFDGRAMIRTAQRHMFVPCEPQNVSTGGVCVRIEENLDPRDEVEVQLVSALETEPVAFRGRVSWTTARLDLREDPPIPYDVGIEFVGLSPHMQLMLRRLMDTMRDRQHAQTAAARSILITLGSLSLASELNASTTAQQLLHELPLKSITQRWGDELYCTVPIMASPESPTQDVAVGDLGYWVEGQSLCLFFGRTPVSIDDNPRPLVPINLVGRFTLDERIRSIHDGTPITIRCAP